MQKSKKRLLVVILVVLAIIGLIFVAKPSSKKDSKEKLPKRTYETNYSDFSNVESEGSN
jgi:Tfp pilus assembly protein PilO